MNSSMHKVSKRQLLEEKMRRRELNERYIYNVFKYDEIKNEYYYIDYHLNRRANYLYPLNLARKSIMLNRNNIDSYRGKYQYILNYIESVILNEEE